MLPTAGANMVVTQVYPIADLGLAAVVTSAATKQSTVSHTGCPATLHVVSKLSSSDDGTLKLAIADTEANITYASGTTDLTVTGTAEQSVTVNTTATDLFWGIEQVSTGSTTWAQLAVFVMYRLPDELLIPEIKSFGQNICSATTNSNSGSGVVTLTIA